MFGAPSGKPAGKALLLIAAATAALAVAAKPPVSVDIAVHQGSGHALVSLGMASVRLAFDSGHSCPKTDTCRVGAL